MMGRRGNGEGSIYRRKDGRWEARYTVHGAGGPRRKVLYGKTRGEVAEKLNKALSDRANGLTFDTGNLTVGKYLDHWLEDCVKSLVEAGKMAHSTFIRYEGIVNNHLKPALGHHKLKNLSRAEVRRLYKEKNKRSPRAP
jgi:integrase